jgi:competence protein ComGC
MRFLVMKKNKSQGIGLVELMLSIAVIAILLMMAMRYYMSTRQAEQKAVAVSMIKDIISAAAEYSIANQHTYNNLSLNALVSGSYLPASFCGSGSGAACGQRANPWKGGIALLQANPPVRDKFVIAFDALPAGICDAMAGIVNTSLKSNLLLSPAACANNLLTVLVQG